MKKFLFILCLLSARMYSHQETLDSRNILILLDQTASEEHIGRPQRIFLTNKLQSAIHEQAMPILVSASIWNAFLEKADQHRTNVTNS